MSRHLRGRSLFRRDFYDTGTVPSEVEGLTLWLDPSTLTYANGATVATWVDRTGTYTFNAVNTPSMVTGPPPHVSLDGAGSEALFSSTGSPPLYPCTRIWAMSPIGITNTNAGIFSHTAGSETDFSGANSSTTVFAGTTVMRNVSSNASADLAASATTAVWRIYSEMYVVGGGKVLMAWGNAGGGSVAALGARTPTRMVIGSRLGGATPGAPFTTMLLGDVVMYDRALEPNEIGGVARYLKVKYSAAG